MDLTPLIKTKSDTTGPVANLNILFATSEIAPYTKTGGLADVSAALPAALAQRGHNVSIITPLYHGVDPEALRLSRRLYPLDVPRKGLKGSKLEANLWEGRTPNGVRIFFIECDEMFGHENPYGYDGDSVKENAERFAFFARAIVEFARMPSQQLDIVQCNDWHTALAPVYARHYYGQELEETSFVLTIHNLAFQGAFDDKQFAATGLPKAKFFNKGGDLRGDDGEGVNYLRAGLRYADQITTVSPTYAEEITEDAKSFGLGETLRGSSDILSGILNGVDYNIWSPDTDREIEVRYDENSLNGKRRNKADLQHAYELPIRPMLPLLGFVGRLTDQKGLDLLLPVLRAKLETFSTDREGFQVVFLGEGSGEYKKALEKLQEDFPRRVGVRVGYEERLAHQIQAGADILLVPSAFEPCGLTQIYALRYGTLPLVHATGGLVDTVKDSEDEGTGFVFDEFSEEALAATIDRAMASFKQPRRWRPMMVRAMNQDFSWTESARSYERVFIEATEQID